MSESRCGDETMDATIQWTEERVEQLKKLWQDGLSASTIAAQLGGVTRNAVIGKVHRLGLSGRSKTVTTSARSGHSKPRPASQRPSVQPLSFGNTALKARTAPAPAPRPMPAAEPIPFPMPTGEKISILQLSERTCRWPIGDPATPEFGFCGEGKEPGGAPYCPYHCRVAYQPVVDRRREKRVMGAR
jgi:GcrA cell cycle regulator